MSQPGDNTLIAVTGTRGIPATWGGVERQCEELYSRLAGLGFSVLVYARRGYVDSALSGYRGVRIKTLPAPAFHPLRGHRAHLAVRLAHGLRFQAAHRALLFPGAVPAHSPGPPAPAPGHGLFHLRRPGLAAAQVEPGGIPGDPTGRVVFGAVDRRPDHGLPRTRPFLPAALPVPGAK